MCPLIVLYLFVDLYALSLHGIDLPRFWMLRETGYFSIHCLTKHPCPKVCVLSLFFTFFVDLYALSLHGIDLPQFWMLRETGYFSNHWSSVKQFLLLWGTSVTCLYLNFQCLLVSTIFITQHGMSAIYWYSIGVWHRSGELHAGRAV